MGVPPGGVQIPDLASAPRGPGCITDLIADGGPNGSYTDVGSVIVTDNGDGTWDVTYQTTGTWELVELQLDVACSLDQIPQTGAGNPKIGKFCYDAEDLDPGTQSYTFEAVSPAECDNGECDGVLFAAHAVVVDTGDCWLEDLDGDGIPETEVCREETGWGEGPGFPGNNWAMYFDCGDCE